MAKRGKYSRFKTKQKTKSRKLLYPSLFVLIFIFSSLIILLGSISEKKSRSNDETIAAVEQNESAQTALFKIIPTKKSIKVGSCNPQKGECDFYPSPTPEIIISDSPTPVTQTPSPPNISTSPGAGQPSITPTPSSNINPTSNPASSTTPTLPPTIYPTSRPINPRGPGGRAYPTIANPPPVSAPDNQINLKVYALIFNPKIPSKNNMTVVDYFGWNDPVIMLKNFVADVQEASHNIVNYTIATRTEADEIPNRLNGTDYTPESYIDCLEGKGDCNGPESKDRADYLNILEKYKICDLVNNDEIDELWLIAGPRFGFYEANMAGPEKSFFNPNGAIWTNGNIITGSSCSKAIHIFGFNYERSAGEMIHDMGHRAEGVLDNYLGKTPNTTGWAEFRTNHYKDPTLTTFGCGGVHYPPNSIKDYDYNNTDNILSECDDWMNYPNQTHTSTLINCSSYNCTQRDFMVWWFNHMPHIPGRTPLLSGNHYQDWWRYIVNR